MQKLESEKKLLVKSNFIIEREEGSKEKLPDDKSVQKSENPTKKSIKPLIEVISENPSISKDSKSILKQEEKSHTSQNVSDCHKKDVSMQQKIIAHIFIYL